MWLESYLDRIGYRGPRAVDADTLCGLHRAHGSAIPYENLDIYLGRPLTLDLGHIYRKLVDERRGGWCYEMNGLFAWALAELGFDVRLLGSTVGEPAQGAGRDLDHLVLLVQLDQPWLADVGFGNGLFEPIPLQPGSYRQRFLEYRLERDGDSWIFHNHRLSGHFYGFTLDPYAWADFAPRCHELQTSPTSHFVRLTVSHRFVAEGIASLRGAVLQRITASGADEEEITSFERYAAVLREVFGLDIPQAEELWPLVWQRHLRWKDSS